MAELLAREKPKKRGIYQDSRGGHGDNRELATRVADFSYESDGLAQLVVETWLGQHNNLFAGTWTQRAAAAKAAFAAKGVYLEAPLVVTEDEYDQAVSLTDIGLASAIVFVQPDQARATTAAAPLGLLETAKMLMAVTPNGI